MSRRRVVITGLGAVTPFGYGADALWEGLLDGRCALRRVQSFDPTGFRCQVAGEATGFQARDHVPKSYRKAVKVMARDIELAVGAAKNAVESAGLMTKAIDPEAPSSYPPERMGCQIGAGLIAAEVPELSMAQATSLDAQGRFSLNAWGEGAINNLTPLWLLKYLPNMLSCHVTILHDAKGPSNTITCSEASGLLSLGESMRVIERGDADACFAGSAESKVNPMGLLRMEFADRLAEVSAPDGSFDASGVVRPFDPAAPGSALAEGAGILILESADTCAARGGTALAHLSGFGAAQSPASDSAAERAEGLAQAVRSAIADAGITAADIDAIVPHASGSRSTDEEEEEALRAVFGDRLDQIELITITPNMGDAIAGSGSIAACVGALAVRNQTLPARVHAGRPTEGLLAGASRQRDARLRHVLVCTNAMGGQNAAIIVSSMDA